MCIIIRAKLRVTRASYRAEFVDNKFSVHIIDFDAINEHVSSAPTVENTLKVRLNNQQRYVLVEPAVSFLS